MTMFFVAREVNQQMRVVARFPDADRAHMRCWMKLYNQEYPEILLWVNHQPDQDVYRRNRDLSARVVDAATLTLMDSGAMPGNSPELFLGSAQDASQKRARAKY